MRISINAGVGLNGPPRFGDIMDEIRAAADAGFHGAWLPQLPPYPGIAPWNPIITAAVAGRSVPDIELGTSVVVAYTQHPLALAIEALTAQAATDGRFTLGVGLSHEPIVAGIYGYDRSRPVRYMREYLDVLNPAVRGEAIDHQGEMLTAAAQFELPGATPPSIVVAALGPQMLRVAGELSDGTVTAWTGPKTISSHIAPRITAGAEAAGRPRPRIVAGQPVSVSDDPDATRAAAFEQFGEAKHLPSYGAMLEHEGLENVSDLVVVGSEEEVTAELRRYADAGATELIAAPFGSPEEQRRTVEFLASLSHDGF